MDTDTRPRLIWGAQAIATFIGVDKGKAYYLLQRGRIPARKVGDEWVAEEGALRAFFSSVPPRTADTKAA